MNKKVTNVIYNCNDYIFQSNDRVQRKDQYETNFWIYRKFKEAIHSGFKNLTTQNQFNKSKYKDHNTSIEMLYKYLESTTYQR